MEALVIVDIQNDFLPGGALAVPHGDAVISVANSLMPAFEFVVATRDWHPLDHGSFASNHAKGVPGSVVELEGLEQILWPAHCVQNTAGAAPPSELDCRHIRRVFHKGTDPLLDSYSGFFDNAHRRETGLRAILLDSGVDSIWVLGLATDYCVKYTALDGVELGFQTWVVEDGCRGVGLQPGDVENAVTDMRAAGVRFTRSAQVLSERA